MIGSAIPAHFAVASLLKEDRIGETMAFGVALCKIAPALGAPKLYISFVACRCLSAARGPAYPPTTHEFCRRGACSVPYAEDGRPIKNERFRCYPR
jgi:hypothetical protein